VLRRPLGRPGPALEGFGVSSEASRERLALALRPCPL